MMKRWAFLAALLLVGCIHGKPKETIDDYIRPPPPPPERCVEFCARFGGGVATIDLSTCVCIVNGVEIRENRRRWHE